MSRLVVLVTLGWLSLVGECASAGKIDRSIGKEPAYRTKAPKYGLLVFGSAAEHRVWLVLDGETLYVDRNGNGDLTEPGKKVAAEKKPGNDPDDEGYHFDVGDVTVGGRTHKRLSVWLMPLRQYAEGSFGRRADVKAALAKDPKTMLVRLLVDVDVPGMKGGASGGRVNFTAGPTDRTGLFCFADQPASAPAVHLGGPLQITFYGELPSLRVGRGSELVLVVGTPGVGPGTFAMLGYEDTVPATVKPVAEVSLPVAQPGAPPIKEQWEIKDRC